MERGLLWLPLLVLFVWLAWAGWNEYQKVEAYHSWAEQFERTKYDIYAVLGQKQSELTWGKPTRRGPVDIKTLSLKAVQSIRLLVDGQPIDLEQPPTRGRQVVLELQLSGVTQVVCIPFTEVSLAARWGQYLQQEIRNWQSPTLG